jgi:hypothetical protein
MGAEHLPIPTALLRQNPDDPASPADFYKKFFQNPSLGAICAEPHMRTTVLKVYNPPSLGGVEIREIHATFFVA